MENDVSLKRTREEVAEDSLELKAHVMELLKTIKEAVSHDKSLGDLVSCFLSRSGKHNYYSTATLLRWVDGALGLLLVAELREDKEEIARALTTLQDCTNAAADFLFIYTTLHHVLQPLTLDLFTKEEVYLKWVAAVNGCDKKNHTKCDHSTLPTPQRMVEFFFLPILLTNVNARAVLSGKPVEQQENKKPRVE